MKQIETDSEHQDLIVPPRREINEHELKGTANLVQAVNKCADFSGLQDKSIAFEIVNDTGQWSKVRSGSLNFPLNKMNHLMNVCGNEMPLEWLAHSRGYGLVRLQTHVEKENEQLKAEKEELEKKLAHFEEFLKLAK